MAQTERVAVYIDGSNLYFKLRNQPLAIQNLNKFDYAGFAKWLARERKLASRRYYVGVVRAKPDNEKGQRLRQEQQRLFAHLESATQSFTIKRGYIIGHDGKYHEKGVDVQLAVDIVIGAYEDMYDTAVVVSSDTDLIPAIQQAKRLGKDVEYVGFAHQPTLALQKYVTSTRLIFKEDLEPFITKTLFTAENPVVNS